MGFDLRQLVYDYWPHILSALLCCGATGLLTLHWLYGLSLHSKNLKLMVYNDKSSTKIFPNKFKVLSQNTWCVPVVGGAKRRQRLQILINKIKKEQPDFICLQELFLVSICGILLLCGDLDFVNKELNKLGYVSCNNPKESLPNFIGFNNGLMTYSKIAFKLCGSVNYDGTHLPFPKSLVCRGLIYSIYQINNNERLLIVNTHLENAVRAAKLSEIKELSNYMKTHLSCTNMKYVMVLGDFNICSNWSWELNWKKEDRLYSVLSRTLKNICGLQNDLFKECKRSFRYELKERPNATYDHMFINDNLQKVNVKHEVKDWTENELVMSDHYGLMAYFDLLQ